ncbi:hypothetical protein HYH03_016796 [Edaphochlamys debaryana]|uniref:Uncharacterized protein n=1 Tax=Edaphochlamys debaryana TaxID=47281 RepID=A0A835XJ65_9CHLO|nr:hypothetical protein HYH03_016796 [Edaphochlamys debaryana]|eukprot:KAG2484380.1 hypothetical protein HYH03_016796 [Edaphochlamys debaryana]
MATGLSGWSGGAADAGALRDGYDDEVPPDPPTERAAAKAEDLPAPKPTVPQLGQAGARALAEAAAAADGGTSVGVDGGDGDEAVTADDQVEAPPGRAGGGAGGGGGGGGGTYTAALTGASRLARLAGVDPGPADEAVEAGRVEDDTGE